MEPDVPEGYRAGDADRGDDSTEDCITLRFPGQARVRAHQLSFGLRGHADLSRLVDTSDLPAPREEDFELRRRAVARSGIEIAERVEQRLAADFPELPVRVAARIEEGTDTAGFMLPPDLLHLVLGDDPVGRIAAYYELAKGLFGLLKKLSDIASAFNDVSVTDGAAMILAADAIFRHSGRDDLELTELSEIRDPFENMPDLAVPTGYLVGFRGDDILFTVAVGLDGRVGKVSEVDVSPIRSAERG